MRIYPISAGPAGAAAPGPSHRTAHLIVINHVDNSAPGTGSSFNAPDFNMQVNGNNTSPTDFPGSESGVDVQLAAGPYGVIETKPITTGTVHQYSVTYSSDCVGTINDGQTKTCTVTNKKENQA